MDSIRLLSFLSLVVLTAFGSGCSSRFEPAPVVSLSTKTASPQNLTEILGDSYTVEAGDTLFAIAFYSGNDYRELAKLNNIKSPFALRLGQRLILKSASTPNAISQTIAPKQTVQTLNKIEVDPTPEQAYGGNKPKIHRKNQNNSLLSSNKSYKNNIWIWPAYGVRTLATVGSDGSKRGLDIKGQQGSRIVAAAGGKIVYAGNALKGYGNLVIIKHDDHYLSAYAHNDSILVGEQTYVKQGQQIATMGNSGASEVMLHFEIRKKGKSMDPFTYLPRH